MFKSYSNLIPKNFLSICNKTKCFTTYVSQIKLILDYYNQKPFKIIQIPSKPTWDLVPIETRSFEEVNKTKFKKKNQ